MIGTVTTRVLKNKQESEHADAHDALKEAHKLMNAQIPPVTKHDALAAYHKLEHGVDEMPRTHKIFSGDVELGDKVYAIVKI